jgi:hypothetical protein
VIRLLALRTGRLYQSANIASTFFSVRGKVETRAAVRPDYLNKKIKWHQRESNTRPSGLYSSASNQPLRRVRLASHAVRTVRGVRCVDRWIMIVSTQLRNSHRRSQEMKQIRQITVLPLCYHKLHCSQLRRPKRSVQRVSTKQSPVPRWPVAGPSGYWLLAIIPVTGMCTDTFCSPCI